MRRCVQIFDSQFRGERESGESLCRTRWWEPSRASKLPSRCVCVCCVCVGTAAKVQAADSALCPRYSRPSALHFMSACHKFPSLRRRVFAWPCACVGVCVSNDLIVTTCVISQDFRDAVATATRQNGKPVVDERILSQVLYYLPQLYQLNRDLLRELEERVAQW